MEYCMERDSFENKVVIITGASSGIGEELALQLAARKAWLVLASRNVEKLEQLASISRDRGGKALAVATDVADEGQCKKMIEKTITEYGRIDTLIANAGYTIGGLFWDHADLKAFKSVMEVNLMGSVYCTFHALPHIKKTGGRIVGVSSVLGKVAAWGHPAYSASKFAMQGFFDNLRNELAGSGVSVTMIYPGMTATNFAGNAVQVDGTRLGEIGRKIYDAKTMSASTCARHIIKAIAKRKRELVLTGPGKFAVIINKFFPGLVDRIAIRMRRRRLALKEKAKK
jgi:short-subunit dehydrogenase